MRTWLHTVLFTVLALGVGLAQPALAARTLAVLPLTKAAGSSDYDGLGDALAGMLVSDLSHAPELSLVERARLDALLAEIELGDSGFVDKKTAAKLGRGVGAELVLVGTFSVVDKTFLLDARIVEVDSGSIRKGGAASGSIDDFVTVEKDLVEELLQGLQVAISSGERRRMLSDSPTEAFGAFAAYGEGLAAERSGRLDAARDAYDRAVAQDPSFAAARASIDRLESTLARVKAREASAIDADRARALDAVIRESSPPGRTGPTEPEAIGELWLRWLALSDRGEDCQVATEKLTWLDNIGWRWPIEARSAEGAALARGLQSRVQAVGYTPIPARVDAPDRTKKLPARRAIVQDLSTFIGAGSVYKLNEEDALVDNLLRCHAGAARVRALADLRARTRKAGVDSVAKRGGLPIGDRLTLAWAMVHAQELGPSAELDQTLAQLLEAPREEAWIGRVRTSVQAVGRALESTRRRTVSRGGASEATLLRFGEAVLSSDPTVIDTERALCRILATNERPRMASFVAALKNPSTSAGIRETNLNLIGPAWRAFHRTGCLTGIDGIWQTPELVLAGVREAASRIDPEDSRSTCQQSRMQLEQQTSDAHLQQMKSWAPSAPDQWTWAVLTMLHALEDNGCIDPMPLTKDRR